MIISAPAKVNLYLKVLNKREDGYHNIITLFERIDLADRIRIQKAGKCIRLASNTAITRRKEDNLAYKAAKAILDFSGCSQGLEIYIEKNIPIAAGLGGGSSDAASVLTGINRLLRLKLGIQDLTGIGKTLGADVPFFLLERGFAVGTDRGDSLEPIDSRNVFYHIIVYPNFHLSTKRVYKKLDSIRLLSESAEKVAMRVIARTKSEAIRHRDCFAPASLRSQSLAMTFFQQSLSRDLTPPILSRGTGSNPEFGPQGLTNHGGGVKIDAAFIGSVLHNDLEPAAVEIRKTIGRIIERLARLTGRKAIMSGSGPSAFCLFQDGKEAQTAKKKLVNSLSTCERRKWQIFIARTL